MGVRESTARIVNLVNDSHEKVKAKGGTTSEPYLLANLPGAIESIPKGVELSELGDTAALPADIVSGKVLYDDEGNPVTGTLPEFKEGQYVQFDGSANPDVDGTPGSSSFDVTGTYDYPNNPNGIIERPGANAVIRNVPTSLFGDAAAADVLKGKTFTSAAGYLLEGIMEEISSDLTVLTGTFTPAQDTHNVAVSHNLGKMPKIILVFPDNGALAVGSSKNLGIDLGRLALAAYVYGHSVAVYPAYWSGVYYTYIKYYNDIDITSVAANNGLISGVTDVALIVDTSNLTSSTGLKGGLTYRYIVAG